MQIQGTVNIQAQQQHVWDYLLNPNSLSECTPGLESWRAMQTPHQYEIVLVRRLSEKRHVRVPVMISWDQIIPPIQLDLNLETTFSNQIVSASGRMILKPTIEQHTALEFSLVFNTANQLFLQMLGNMVPTIVEQFFKCIKARLEAETAVSRLN